ncbi:putative LOC107376942-like protein [Nothobranchius furzeri]|uniref:LOC107376942-like protein n=1 Tax=Nothobranchius furzeri TaxID=105023 RepID=A0A9D3C4Q7_NOTFU|nr:putative LOC107376942-like protein [Nothobranchius furzeri]
MVRVTLKWKYPFQPPMDVLQGRDVEDRAMNSTQREERREEVLQRPTAKPRVKTEPREAKAVQKETKAWPQSPTIKHKSSQDVRSDQITTVKPRHCYPSVERRKSTRTLTERSQKTPHLTPESTLRSHRSSVRSFPRQSVTTASRGCSVSDAGNQDLPSVDQVSVFEAAEEGEERSESGNCSHTFKLFPSVHLCKCGILRIDEGSLILETNASLGISSRE